MTPVRSVLRRAATLVKRPGVRRAAGALASALLAEWMRGRGAAADPDPQRPSRPSSGAPGTDLRLRPAAFERLLGFEGFSPTWYRNGEHDRWTVGYGTTEGVLPGLTRAAVPGPVSEADARRWAAQVVTEKVEPSVARAVQVPLTPGQFDALVLFAYNLGGAALRSSTLLKKLNAGDAPGAAAEFDRWVYAGKTVLRGLVARRAAERRLFEGKDG